MQSNLSIITVTLTDLNAHKDPAENQVIYEPFISIEKIASEIFFQNSQENTRSRISFQ